MKKIIALLTIFLSLCGFCFADDFEPVKENVKLLGRTFYDGDVLWNCYSATGIAFKTDSSRVEITLNGDTKASGQTVEGNTSVCRVGIFIDGVRSQNILVNNPEENIVVYEDNSGTHEIKIVKLSESTSSVFGIQKISVNDGTIITPSEEKNLKIEFIGDSITCGYGVDDEDRNHHFSTQTEDATKTYAYKTCSQLNADYSMISCSGWGVISGYSGDGRIRNKQIMSLAYDKTGFTYSAFGKKAYMGQRLPWDFSTWQPDLVVINLGTNDNSYTKKDSEKCRQFEEGYISLIKTVREKNPDAEILCVLGLMGADLFPNIQNAVKAYSEETGDTKVSTFKLPQTSVYAADWHPAEKSHQTAADALVKKINALLEKK